MIKETRRQKYTRVNLTLKGINKSDKSYCWQCIIKHNKITESHECKEHKQTYTAKYCRVEKSFKCHLGNNCRSCHGKKYGLGNPDVHKATIKTQLEKGTFNMLDPEIQRTKSSNSNLTGGIKRKNCLKCGKETYHIGKRCIDCEPFNTGIKLKHCSECGSTTYHNGGICTVCNPGAFPLTMKNTHCKTCEKETFHVGNRCMVCDPWERNNGFDREDFYESKIHRISFNYSGRSISLDDIDSLLGVPGVWTKETTNGTVLDVAQTQDIGNEMLFSIRALDVGRQNLHKPDSYFDDKPSIYRKYRDIASNGEIVFRLVATGVTTKEERERIEA